MSIVIENKIDIYFENKEIRCECIRIWRKGYQTEVKRVFSGLQRRQHREYEDCCSGDDAKMMSKTPGYYDVNEKRQNQQLLILPELVRVKGLEPLRRTTPDPKSGASAIPPHSLDMTGNSLPYFSLLFKLVVIFTNFAKSIGKGQQV